MLPIRYVFLGMVGRFYDQTASMISTLTWFPIAVNSPPVLLIGGHEYIASTEEESRVQSSLFRAELDSIPWMTYRSSFAPCAQRRCWWLPVSLALYWETSITRSGMVEADLLSVCRYGKCSVGNPQVFKAGEWFSPGSAAFLMAAQVQSAFHTGVSSVSGMYTSTGRISSRQILSRLEEASGALIFIPLRLCSDDALEIARFSTDIRKWFTMPQFRGFVGGDYISQSYYFVGASEEYLYILDPHTVQPAVIEKVTDISMQFPPQPVVATMRWARLSPTMTLAFFVRDRTDLESIKNAKPLGLDVV